MASTLFMRAARRQHDRSDALFYYFRLEDQVSETHLCG
jgi:hypothetical protein